MENFLKGFEKTAKVYSNIMAAITSKPVAHKVISGAEFQAKQRALLAAREATRQSAKASTVAAKANPAQRFAQAANDAASRHVTNSGKLSNYSQTVQAPKLNAGSQYRKEGLGVDRTA